ADVCRHALKLLDRRNNDTAIVTFEQLSQPGNAVRVFYVIQPQRSQVLEHLIFQLVAVDHHQDRGLLRLGSFEQELRRLDHRIGLAASLRVPDQPSGQLRVQRSLHDFLHPHRLMLAQDVLAQLLFLLGKDDVVFQELQDMRDGAEAFDLRFEIANLLVLPVKNVTSERIPGYAVGKPDGLRRCEEHLRYHDFRRFDMVTANLVHSQRDRLVLTGVLTLDDQHGDTVNEKNHILPCAVMTVMKIKLFRYLIDVAVFFGTSSGIVVINQDQVQFPIIFGAEEFALIAQVGKKLTVAGNVRIEP